MFFPFAKSSLLRISTYMGHRIAETVIIIIDALKNCPKLFNVLLNKSIENIEKKKKKNSAISSSSPTTKKFTIMDIVEMVRGASTPEQLEYLMKEIIQAGPTSGNERAKRLEAVKLAHHLAMRWMESLSTATEKIMAAKRLLSSDGGDDDGDVDDDDDDNGDGGVHDEERRVTFDPATPLNRTPSPRLDDTLKILIFA